ncbi:hypothetical protein Selin_2137 [Desulfurispirillum indicum S5]|uniref:Uncharacterized protein n=1 Tax=Desulfurispirillum indicum (strain ATCC BAA-1389 / DSM 22839 / S5) TaxID=653733 RepID=E6W3A3_DESIS|nr:hypothetical protein Selin_2137 [Desulfurispirillum indicum S5]
MLARVPTHTSFLDIVLFDRAKMRPPNARFSGSPDPCLPAALPDHSLPVSVLFRSCQPGFTLTGRAQGGTACFCLSPVGWPSQNAKTGTLWTRRVDATRAATANQKPRRAVVCGPQFQASGRLIRTALGVAFAPLLATQKWQKKLTNKMRANVKRRRLCRTISAIQLWYSGRRRQPAASGVRNFR